MEPTPLQPMTVRRRIQQAAPRLPTTAYVLYYGSPEVDDWCIQRAGGETFYIPPDAEATHPLTGEHKRWDGTLVVRDIYGASPDEQEEAREQGRPAPRNRIVLPAGDILAHLHRKLSPRGVVLLTGDPKQDKVQKAGALRAWVEWRRNAAIQTRMAYHKRNERWMADPRNKNKPGPPMNEAEVKAEEFLAGLALGNFAADLEAPASKYQCQEDGCGYHTADPDKFAEHMAVMHPKKQAEADQIEQAEAEAKDKKKSTKDKGEA